jgi:acetyl esterase/lipase
MSYRVWAALLICASAFAGEKSNYNIHLWEPGQVPLAQGDGPLDNPFVTVFLPPENKRNGAAMIVAPGGSNIMLMYGVEGMQIAEKLNDWGIAAFVLTYRLSPRYNEAARVADGKRAIELIRSRASEWKVDPKRIGYIGFSAGSNLGRSVAAAAPPGDPGHPDYLVLVYGAGRPTQGETLKAFPPTFLIAAADDRGASLPSAQLFQDLTRAGAVAEIHIYQKGHHGFGAGYGAPEFSDWMGRLEHFLKIGKVIP